MYKLAYVHCGVGSLTRPASILAVGAARRHGNGPDYSHPGVCPWLLARIQSAYLSQSQHAREMCRRYTETPLRARCRQTLLIVLRTTANFRSARQTRKKADVS